MDDIAIIAEHEAALRSAMLNNDVSALSDLIDDDLVFTGPDGSILSKEADLSTHRDKLLRLDKIDLHDSQTHRLGPMILVTTKADLSGQFGDFPIGGTFAYTRLWRQSGSRWRIVAGHAAKIG
ncbi:MAG TPA: nuclear transport factor 2 family protein [Roseiarcus sp.]